MIHKIKNLDSLSNKFYSLASKNKKSAAGICFICTKDFSIFLCLRSKHVTFSNTWGIPGGKIEPEESEIDAAIREINEELGSTPEVSECEVIDALIFDSPSLSYTTFIVDISLQEKEKWKPSLNKEHDKYEWFEIDSLPKNLHPGVKQTVPVIKDIFSFIKKIDN